MVCFKRLLRENVFGFEGDGENIGVGVVLFGLSDFDRFVVRFCCDWMFRKDNATLFDGVFGVEVFLFNLFERNIFNEFLMWEEDDGGV